MILHWLSFGASVVVGVNFIGLAVFLTMGIKTRRLGVVLGVWALWSLIFFLAVAAIDSLLGAYAVMFPIDRLSLVAKFVSAIASTICLLLVAKGVFRLRRLPLSIEVDKAFSELRVAMNQLRDFHEHGRIDGRQRRVS